MGCRMGPIANSRCSSTAASSPGQPDSPLAMAMACKLAMHKYIPMATEVSLLLLCVHCWFLRDGFWAFGNRPLGYVSLTANFLVSPPFEQLGQNSPSKVQG